MAYHPRYKHGLDELFLHVYVYIDDWLEPYRPQLPKHSVLGKTAPGEGPGRRQKASIGELLTIAVVGELLAQPFESTWYWVVQRRFKDLFPNLPEYSRYHLVLRNAEPLLAGLALSAVTGGELHLIDSKPLLVAKGRRAQWAKLPEATKGFSTMGMVHGFKLHALTDEQGLFKKWAFASANHSDVMLAGELLEGMSDQLVLGDKAYLGSSACTPKRKNMVKEDSWQS